MIPTLFESRSETANDSPGDSTHDRSPTVGSDEEPPSVPELSLDVVFDILRNRRRRMVLAAIEERDGSTTLSELAEHIGGIENDKPPGALNAQERKRVYVGLYQCHLPKMDDANAIEFDKNRGTVERGAMADTYHTYLERGTEPTRPWERYYAGLAVGFGILLVATAVLASGMIAAVSLLSLTAFAGLSAYHWSVVSDD